MKEYQLQIEIVKYLRELENLQYFLFWHNHNNPSSRKQGYLLKCMGLKSGLPDIFILHNSKLYGLEIKTERGTLSKAQKELHAKLRNFGIAGLMVVRSVEDVHNFLITMKIIER